jgi:hypothetical protein
MMASDPIFQNGSKSIKDLTTEAAECIQMYSINTNNEGHKEKIFSIIEKITQKDIDCKDPSLQLLIGSIQALPETIDSLAKHHEFSQDDIFFVHQMQNAIKYLRRMGNNYQNNDLEDFNKNHIKALIATYALDVFEATLTLSQAIDGLKNNDQDKVLLGKLGFLYGKFLPQIDYAENTKAKTILQALILAIKTTVDFWNKATSIQQEELLTNLGIMKNKINDLLYQPRYEDLEEYKSALQRIQSNGSQILENVNAQALK